VKNQHWSRAFSLVCGVALSEVQRGFALECVQEVGEKFSEGSRQGKIGGLSSQGVSCRGVKSTTEGSTFNTRATPGPQPGSASHASQAG
jgi:hypothetical protein